MKIEVHDIQHIVEQVKEMHPPRSKDAHKLMNNLAILLEKNTTKKESPEEVVLTGHLEKLNEKFLDLCFLRKETVESYGKEYSEMASKTALALQKNREAVAAEQPVAHKPIVWDLEVGQCDVCQMIPGIFSKLKKAKGVIEDALESSVPAATSTDADCCFEAYVSSL